MLSIPADNRRLIEAVYHRHSRQPLWEDPSWEDYLCGAEGVELNQTWRATVACQDFGATYLGDAAQFDGPFQGRTRLGDETVRVELDRSVAPFYAAGEAVHFVDLPVWALPASLHPGDGLNAAWDPLVTGFRLENRVYRYTPTGWTWRAE